MADIENLKKVLGDVDYSALKSEAESLGKEISDALSKGYKNALYQSDISVRRAFDTRYKAIKYQLEFGVISEEEYYDKLESIRDAYFSRNSQEWYKYTSEIYEYRLGSLKEYENAVKEHFSETAEGAEKLLSQISEAREKYEGKLLDFAGEEKGFETHTIKIHGYYPTGDPLVFDEHTLSDLDEDIERLKDFNETIEALKARGNELSPENFKEFFSEMRNLSVEDANILAKLLLKENDKDFIDYLADYKEKKLLSEEISKNLYKDDFSYAAEEIKAELSESFSEIPNEFFELGGLTAENFKEGFIGELQNLFSGVSEILNEEGISLSINSEASGGQKNFNATYNFYGSGESVSSQLIAARNFQVLEKLRGL